MGCDIHIRCEVKRNNKWELNTKEIFPNPYYKLSLNGDFEWTENEFTDTPDDSRNYDWFSILADVRNGDMFSVISEPRGIPNDASDGWKEEAEQWKLDMHSHSYLTIEDFDNFDWNQTTIKYGVISLKDYETLRNTTNSPKQWCGYVSGDNNITVDSDIADTVLENPEVGLNIIDDDTFYMDRIVTIDTKNGIPASNFNINVHYEWPVTYKEWFDYKIKNIIEPMKKLKEEYEDVRIVFGFDN